MQDRLKKIVVVDYQLGNLYSVEQAFRHLGVTPVISSKKEDILEADGLVLPGVGAFGDAMINMHKLDLVSPVREFAATGKPFMGVCLGLQLLFTESEEFGVSKGLGLIEGRVRRFSNDLPDNAHAKVPQIGWNTIAEGRMRWDETPLRQLASGDFQYFVHSYYSDPDDSDVVLAVTNYEGFEYCSAINKSNIFACQFHPEKSGEKGLTIYNNWINKIL